MGIERIFYRRDYRIDDGRNTMIAAASYWLLLDLTTLRPVVFPLNEQVLKTNEGRTAMTMPADGFAPVPDGHVEIHRVKFSDIDQNRHVNNARYVEWIFDLLDEELLEKKSPASFSIEYKHEVKSGDVVELRRQRFDEENIAFHVEGRISGTNQVCVRSKIVFP